MRCSRIERGGFTLPQANQCTKHSRLRCHAKGNQKNDGVYFTYRPTGKSKEQIAEEQKKKEQKEQEQFGWANAARSTVQQYRKSVNSQRPKKTNTQLTNPSSPAQQQQQAQAKQQTKQNAAAAANPAPPTLQPKLIPNTTSTVDEAAAAAPVAGSMPAATEPDKQSPPPATAAAVVPAANNSTTTTSTITTSASSSSGTNRSSKETTVQQRKLQMLQRMQGSTAAATAVTATGSSASTSGDAEQPLTRQPGAAAGAAAAAAAGAAGAAAWENEPLMAEEGDLLLQELIELAEQLAGRGGYNSVIDSDPLSDPLAGLYAEDAEPSSMELTAFAGYIEAAEEGSAGAGAAGGEIDGAEAEEFIAAVAAVQRQARSAAAALAADDAVPDYITESDIDSSNACRVGSAAVELLAWEAEHTAGRQQIDIEAAAAAMQRGEVLGDDDAEDREEDDEEEDALDQGDVDWLDKDPQLRKMLQADGAAFARMLAELNDDDAASSSSEATVAAREVQRESWADLEMEDWLTAGDGYADAVHDDNEEGELSGLLGAINADSSLDQQAKMQAKLNIQGMFNDPTVAAGSSSQRQRSSSKRPQQAVDSSGKESGRVSTTTRSVASEQQVVELRPKPVRPPVPE